MQNVNSRKSVLSTFILAGCSLLFAEFGPGDIFREYVWKGPWVNASKWQRVTDPDCGFGPRCEEFLPNPLNSIIIDDLNNAVKAEICIERLQSHAGTSNKRIRVNGNSWNVVREVDRKHIGSPPECFMTMIYPCVQIPLSQLNEGTNTFEFTTDGQICYDFNWGQWIVYGVTFRIYYSPSKPHPTGTITFPKAGGKIGDNPVISATATSGSKVDFIANYLDFDYEGNGQYTQWHYRYRYGAIKSHVGSKSSAPYSVTWNTSWVPDQKPDSIKLMARVTKDGISYITPAVEDITLERPDFSVEFCNPRFTPKAWATRNGERDSGEVLIKGDLTDATAAQMIIVSWCGVHAEGIGINSKEIVKSIGVDHDYSYDEKPVPLSYLKEGRNYFYTYSTTHHHGIEVQWPGIALKVKYDKPITRGKAPKSPPTKMTRNPDFRMWQDTNRLTVKPMNLKNYQIRIVRANGEILGLASKKTGDRHVFSTKGLESGIYFVTTKSQKANFSERFLILN